MSNNCVIAYMTARTDVPAAGNNPGIPPITSPTRAKFAIKKTQNLILPKRGNVKVLNQLELGLKRSLSWNKYFTIP